MSDNEERDDLEHLGVVEMGWLSFQGSGTRGGQINKLPPAISELARAAFYMGAALGATGMRDLLDQALTPSLLRSRIEERVGMMELDIDRFKVEFLLTRQEAAGRA